MFINNNVTKVLFATRVLSEIKVLSETRVLSEIKVLFDGTRVLFGEIITLPRVEVQDRTSRI